MRRCGFGGVAQIAFARPHRGLAPALVVERRHHLDQRRDDRIARCCRDAAMEVDVVNEEDLRVLHRREQARDFFGQRRDLLRRRPLGREAGGADFEDAAGLVHLVAGEAVQRREEAQGVGIERRRTIRDVGARAVPRPDDAHRRQRAQPGADRRPADADLEREIALGGQPIAGLQRAALDQLADVRHDLAGTAFAAGARCRVADDRSSAGCASGHKRVGDIRRKPAPVRSIDLTRRRQGRRSLRNGVDLPVTPTQAETRGNTTLPSRVSTTAAKHGVNLRGFYLTSRRPRNCGGGDKNVVTWLEWSSHLARAPAPAGAAQPVP